MAATARSKSVAARMKRRLVQWFEHHPYSLLHHAVDHVGNPQPSLTSACFRNPYPPDIARLVRSPRSVRRTSSSAAARRGASHLVDALSIRTGRTSIRRYFLKGHPQKGSHPFHRRRTWLLRSLLFDFGTAFVAELGWRSSATTIDLKRFRVQAFSCLENQSELPRLLVDRDPFPSPGGLDPPGWARLSTVLWYIAVALTSAGPLALRSFVLRTTAFPRSPADLVGKNLRLRDHPVANTSASPTRTGLRRYRPAHPMQTPYGASLSFDTVAHL